jgi:predicted metal-dependent peptidase
MTDLAAIETKLAAARTRLILDKPFLGALVLRLPMVAADPEWCPTTATDARKFYFNAQYIERLSMSQTQFMLAHEALHCGLSHFARRQHRVRFRWDQACDFAINPLLVEEGLSPPPNSLLLSNFKGMTAEEIYPCLDESHQDEPLDHHAYDSENQQRGQQPRHKESDLTSSNRPPQADQDQGQGAGDTESDEPQPDQRHEPRQQRGQGDPERSDRELDDQGKSPPPPLTPEEQATLAVQWQQRMAGAAQQAMQAGKLGGTLARMIEHLLQPQLPWRMLLARYMTAMARDDFSYTRPSRREGDFILPSLRSAQVDVVVAVDTSGSVRPAEIDEFIAEINALKGQMRARVMLLACDSQIARGCPWVYEPWEEFRMPDDIKGGGGTDFQPVFDWIGGQGLNPELLVYFTDAEGSFPKQEPPFPVIWLVKGRLPVPWGQRIQLN